MSLPLPLAHARAAVRGSERAVVVAMAVIVAMLAALMALRVFAYAHPHSAWAEAAFWLELAALAVIFGATVTAGPMALRVMRERRRATEGALQARAQVEQLFRMTDMLQSAMDHADANAVMRATAERLLAGYGGALYVFNNSRDRLDLSVAWDWPGELPPPATIAPSQCWALKRGKSHSNLVGQGALRCTHYAPTLAVLEIPMMARGEVYGLLNIQAGGAQAERRLADVARLAGAIADAMSLALSNIALREQLRTQALRDPLTGLYNRRYMEDVLVRFAGLAERNGTALAAIMVDLDHFKRLNDEHGHAQGDVILRNVAGRLAGAIRQCDVACRYGGEELIVLLPDCGLDDALDKAELLRLEVQALSSRHGVTVTASFGVAALPDTTSQAIDLIAAADAALYQAKKDGRNRVCAAARRVAATPAAALAAVA